MINLVTVIYADILIIINIIVNYLLLRASVAITGCSFKPWRFLLSAGAGGIFSLIIFIENLPVIANLLLKITFLAIMMLIAFNMKSVKAFMKCCAAFFMANFVFAGIMLAVSTMLFPNSAMYKNGAVYFDMDILTLTVTAIVCYIILNLIAKFTKSKTPEKSIYSIAVTYDGKTVEGKALFDSGNTLCDCFSGRPVIIAEKEFVAPLLKGTDLTQAKNFRLIPFTTIKNGGALPSFSADKIEITVSGRKIDVDNIYIGVTEKKIVSGGYSALIGTPFFDAIGNKISAERGRKIRQ